MRMTQLPLKLIGYQSMVCLAYLVQPKSLPKEKFTLRKIKARRPIVPDHIPKFESPFITAHFLCACSCLHELMQAYI